MNNKKFKNKKNFKNNNEENKEHEDNFDENMNIDDFVHANSNINDNDNDNDLDIKLPTLPSINKKKMKGFYAFSFNHNIMRGINRLGYKLPTPIQKKVIPEIMSGFNIIANSRTGSGKTAAFLLPILNRLKEHSKIVGTRCLILSPTRELAYQTLGFCKKLASGTDLRMALLVGGAELEGQFDKLAQNPDIIIATPGRVMHHLEEGSLSLKKIEILCIDEADKMFELGYEDQLNHTLKNCPSSRQVLLFSATIPSQLSQFMKAGIREYKLITLDEESKVPEKLKMHVLHCRTEDKKYALLALTKTLIKRNDLTLIFLPTKYHCEYFYEVFKAWEIDCLYIYGSLEQELRNNNLDAFRKRKVNILLVTDVAARGLDIPLLDSVINFDFPDKPNLFIHRVGRTARAGQSGTVYCLVTNDDLPYLIDCKVYLGRKLALNTTNISDELTKEKLLNDTNIITFGKIPDDLVNSVRSMKLEYSNNKIDIESLEESARKALTKAKLFREKPSSFGIKQSKEINTNVVSPLYSHDKNEEEKEKENFLLKLKNFKPNNTIFERENETKLSEDVIYKFKKGVQNFKKRKDIEKQKQILMRDHRKDYDDDDDYLNNDEQEEENNQKSNKNENKNQLLNKKVKRSQIRNFKENSHYISDKPSTDSKNLWGSERPLNLDELTLNILPEDDHLKNSKKLVWDKKKKNFVRAAVDKQGNLIRKNEAGVKIKDKDKRPSKYSQWKKSNNVRVQNVGETENDKLVKTANNMFTERKFNKGKKGPKNELKNFDQILKDKKQKFKNTNRGNFSKRDYKIKMIQEKSHMNRKSMALVKRRRK